MSKSRTSQTRSARVHPMRLLAVVAAVALLTVGAGVLEAGPSSAAPGDQITTAEMPDQGLRDAVNDALSQPQGSTFTEGQAATIGFLNGRDRGITELDGIEYLTGLGNLRLFDNPLDDTDAQYLANHAAALSNVTILNIGSTDVGDVGATAIANNLTGLTRLNLSYTDVGDAGATAIAANLTNLTDLNLTRTDVADAGATAIATNLANLTSLSLGGSDVGDVGATAIANNLTSLTRLDLGNTDVGDAGATAIAENLTSLTRLALSFSDVGDVGATAIAANLANLTSLSLGGSDVGDAGAIAIADNLASLTFLDLGFTDVGDAGAIAIADNLASLTGLSLSFTDVADVGAAAIGNNLAGLTSLQLKSNSVSDISPLSALTSLDTLSLDDQQITAASAVAGDATANPVVDENGDPVAVTSSDPGFNYDAGSDTWTFSSPGSKTLTWSTNVTIGSETVEFSGTITQQVGEAPTPVSPEAPYVTQTSCAADGGVVTPSVVPAATDGITYSVDGDVAPGETVTVVATADPDFALDLSGADGWVDNGDGTASFEVTLDAVDCSSPATTVPDETPGPTTVPDGGPTPVTTLPGGSSPASQPGSGSAGAGTLPATGPSVPLMPLVAIGLGLAILGAGLGLIRRRTLHNG